MAWQGRLHSSLVEKRLVPEDKAKYFVGWVERFLQTAKAEAGAEVPAEHAADAP